MPAKTVVAIGAGTIFVLSFTATTLAQSDPFAARESLLREQGNSKLWKDKNVGIVSPSDLIGTKTQKAGASEQLDRTINQVTNTNIGRVIETGRVPIGIVVPQIELSAKGQSSVLS